MRRVACPIEQPHRDAGVATRVVVNTQDSFTALLGRVHTFERFDDDGEVNEETEDHIQLVEP